MVAPRGTGHVRQFPGNKTKYRLVRSKGGRQQLEHRVVMEKVLGRPLLWEEVVHHKDENGLNNNPDNLEILSRAEHKRRHMGPYKWNLEEALKLRNEGRTFGQIAEVLGVTWTAIRAVFHERGISTTDKRWGKNKWPVEEAIEKFKAGVHMSRLARLYGVSPQSVRKAFVKRGVV